jgi:hypothetical protein
METAVTSNPHIPANPPSLDSAPEPALVRAASPVSTTLESHSATGTAALTKDPKTAWRRWLDHLALLLFVILCTVVGLWLSLLPWSLQWTDNPLLWTHPDLRTFLGYGFVRGVCSGLGLLDLWIGIREAADYFEKISLHK